MQDWPNNSNVFLRKSLSADNLHAADAFLRKSLSAEILEILGASAKLVSAAVLKGTNVDEPLCSEELSQICPAEFFQDI